MENQNGRLDASAQAMSLGRTSHGAGWPSATLITDEDPTERSPQGTNSVHAVLQDQDKDGLGTIHQELVNAYQPRSAAEALAIGRLAEATAQLKRLERCEVALLDSVVAHARQTHPKINRTAAIAALFCDGAGEHGLRALQRYQQYRETAQRRHDEALRHLERCQKNRRSDEIHEAKLAQLRSRVAPNQKPNKDRAQGSQSSPATERTRHATGSSQSAD